MRYALSLTSCMCVYNMVCTCMCTMSAVLCFNIIAHALTLCLLPQCQVCYARYMAVDCKVLSNTYSVQVYFFFKRSNNRHTKQKKKRAIVQQTIGITDNVAVHECVHYRLVCALQYTLQSLGVNQVLIEQQVQVFIKNLEGFRPSPNMLMASLQ